MLIGSEMKVPDYWEFHPTLGLLPQCFIDTRLIYKWFPNVKLFETRLVKDYESFAKIAIDLNEELLLSAEECQDIVNLLIRKHLGNKDRRELSQDEKCSIAARMYHQFHIPAEMIAQTLPLQEKIVRQLIRSKDFGRISDL